MNKVRRADIRAIEIDTIQGLRTEISQELGRQGWSERAIQNLSVEIECEKKRLLDNRQRQLATESAVDCRTVTVLQASASVNRSKRTLERYKKEMPAPTIKGTKGMPSEWRWPVIRQWLMKKFNRSLPERFPEIRTIAALIVVEHSR